MIFHRHFLANARANEVSKRRSKDNGDKKNNGRYITQDELKEAFAECSANEITEAMRKDPMIGVLIMVVTAKVCGEVEHKLFDERKDNDKKEVKE